jgi:hypothetical protein
MPNWLFAALMTVPVRFTGVGGVDVGLGAGGLVWGCDGISLGDADSGALGVSALVAVPSPQPASTMAHTASTALRRIRISSLPRLRPYNWTLQGAGYVICR